MSSRLAGAVCCVAATVLLTVSAAAVAGDRQTDYIQLRVLIGEQRFSEAFDRCQALIAKYPDYVYLYETLAEIALYAQDLGGAAKFFEERIEDGTGLELSYFGLGTVYFNMAAYREAALCFDRATELGISAPECYRNFVYAYERLEGVDASIRFFNSLCHRDPKNPRLWYAVALAYWSKRDYPTVLKNINEALSRNPTEQKYLQAKAAVMLLLNRRNEAAAMISRLLSDAVQSDDLNGVQFLRSYLVLTYELGGDSSNAKACTWASLNEAKSFGLYRWVGWGYERMADYEFLSCGFELSLSYSTMAVDASTRCSDRSLLFAAMVRQYESQMELGEYKNALESVRSRVSLFNNSNPSSDSISAFIDIAWAYHELGDDNTAIEYAIEALTKAEAAKPNISLSLKIHNTLGMIYEGLGNHSAAANSFLSSMQYVGQDKVGVMNLAILHGNIGRAYMALGAMSQSLEHLETELRLTKKAGFQKEEAYAHNHLGRYYLKSRSLKRSEEEFSRALQLGRRLGQKQVMLTSTRGLAQVAEARGDLVNAVRLYRAVIVLSEAMTMPSRHPWFTSNLERERQNDYRECVRILCRLNRYDEAFLTSELSHLGNVLYSSIVTQRRIVDLLPEPQRTTLGKIATEVLKKRAEAAADMETMLSNLKSPNFQLTDQIAILEAEFAHLVEESEVENPAINERIRIRPQPATAICTSILAGDEALIEFSIAETESNVFLLRRDTLVCRSLKIGRSEIRRMVAAVSGVFDRESGSEHLMNVLLANFSAKASSRIYSQLFSWCEPYLLDTKSLIIVADDFLRGFPFESLVCSVSAGRTMQDFSGAHFLLERFSVRYAGAATLLDRSWDKRKMPMKFLLAVGDPPVHGSRATIQDVRSGFLLKQSRNRYMPHLPGARKEVRTIQSLLNSHSDVITNEAATKRMLLSAAREYRVIHIASHLTVDSRDPLFSRIYLAEDPESGDSGILYGFELLNAEINAELVVLSSCNSAQPSNDNNAEGIVDAFVAAGVPSVIGTLWSVDDQSSSTLMERFYVYLLQGMPTSAALQKAKIDLINSGRIDPFYWAGFVLIGDGSPVRLPLASAREWSHWTFATSLASLVTFSLLLLWFRRGFPNSVWHAFALTKK